MSDMQEMWKKTNGAIEVMHGGATFVHRPRYQATTFAEIERIAQVILDSCSYPPNCDNINKLVMMILAGNDIGLSPMQSMASITPPINGKCALYGDMGLALVRASGALEVFVERIEGSGDERTAYTKIKRSGFPEKEFAYSMSQAKKLKSYKFAYEINSRTKLPGGGPWYEDPDNMLQWRARWRAIRSEFTDVLNGMGGVEEVEDVDAGDTITVEATPTPTPAAQQSTSPPSPPTPPAITQGGKATEQQIAEMRRLLSLFMPGVDKVERLERWKQELVQFNVDKGSELTDSQADEFLQRIGETCDPFTYRPASPTT